MHWQRFDGSLELKIPIFDVLKLVVEKDSIYFRTTQACMHSLCFFTYVFRFSFDLTPFFCTLHVTTCFLSVFPKLVKANCYFSGIHIFCYLTFILILLQMNYAF